MKTKCAMVVIILTLVSQGNGDTQNPAPWAVELPKVSIDEIEASFSFRGAKEASRQLYLLSALTDPNLDQRKIPLLVRIYEAFNTPEVDELTQDVRYPPRERTIQISALVQLGRIPAVKSGPAIRRILTEYLDFMKQNGAAHPRSVFDMNMAVLIMKHVEDAGIREIGRDYIASGVFPEWVNGRIAGAIMKYNVKQISDAEDPNLTRRMDDILQIACRPTVEDMLRSPWRVGDCREAIMELVENQPSKLRVYIERKGQLTEPQKYFLAHTAMGLAIRKEMKNEKLSADEAVLLEKAKAWRQELLPKTQAVERGDQLLEMSNASYEKLKNVNSGKESQ